MNTEAVLNKGLGSSLLSVRELGWRQKAFFRSVLWVVICIPSISFENESENWNYILFPLDYLAVFL